MSQDKRQGAHSDPIQEKLKESKERLEARSSSTRKALAHPEARIFEEWLGKVADTPSYAIGRGTTPTDVAYLEGRRQLAMEILKLANLR